MRPHNVNDVPTTIVSLWLAQLGTLRDVSRTLRTEKRWARLGRQHKFWTRVLRCSEDLSDDRVMARISFGLSTGSENTRWENWTCERNDGDSTVRFLKTVMSQLGAERMMIRFMPECVFFDRHVIDQASQAAHFVLMPGVHHRFVLPNAHTIRIIGNLSEDYSIDDLPETCGINLEITKRQSSCLRNWKHVNHITSVYLSCRVFADFFRLWCGEDSSITNVETSMGCPLGRNLFRYATGCVLNRESFMPTLRHLGWLEIYLSTLPSFWAQVKHMVELLFPKLRTLKILLEVHEPLDTDTFKSAARQDLPRLSGKRVKLCELSIGVWWGIDSDCSDDMESHLSKVGSVFAESVTVCIRSYQ